VHPTRGKEDTISGSQLAAAGLTPEHRELVAEHHNLEFLELLGPKAQRRELQKPCEHDVAEQPEQDRSPPGRRNEQTTLGVRLEPPDPEPS